MQISWSFKIYGVLDEEILYCFRDNLDKFLGHVWVKFQKKKFKNSKLSDLKNCPVEKFQSVQICKEHRPTSVEIIDSKNHKILNEKLPDDTWRIQVTRRSSTPLH